MQYIEKMHIKSGQIFANAELQEKLQILSKKPSILQKQPLVDKKIMPVGGMQPSDLV